MATSFKALVRPEKKRSDNTWNIKIRVTHNRASKYISTPWYATADDLTSRTFKIKNQRYLDLCDEKIRFYRKAMDSLGAKVELMEIDGLISYITNWKEDDNKFTLDFVAYTNDHIKRLQDTGHAGNAKVITLSLGSLVKYMGRDVIDISEINAHNIRGWIAELSKTTVRACSQYPSALRAVFNRAKKEFNDEYAGIINIPQSPFQHVDIPSVPVVKKRALTKAKIRKLATLPYQVVTYNGYNRYNMAKDMWLLSFGLVGMNAVDLYNCTDYQKGRITYQRTKTKNRRADHAEISIKVDPRIKPLVEKYRDKTGERVFDFYHHYSTADAFSENINKALKDIGDAIGEPGLQFYSARHSWATIAANDAKVDGYVLQQALNHVDENMKITDRYVKRSWKPIDDANKKVLDIVNLPELELTEVQYRSLSAEEKEAETKRARARAAAKKKK